MHMSEIGAKTKKNWKISKHRYNMQHKLLYFDLLSCNMTSNGIKFIWMDSKLQELSNGTKNTKFEVWMRKLWPQKSMVVTKEHPR